MNNKRGRGDANAEAEGGRGASAVSGPEAQRVADRVLERILSGQYPPGLRLPSEAELATELRCGRSTVREALQKLATIGVVRSRRGSGAVVLDFRREGSLALLGPWITQGRLEQPLSVLVVELLRMRTMLACEGARLAALYAGPRSLEPVAKLVARSRELEGEPAAHAANDLELHRALVASSGLWPAVWLSNAIWQPLAELSQRFPVLAIVPPGYADRMTELLARIATHDVEGAIDLMAQHLAAVDALMAARLGPLANLPDTAGPAARLRFVLDAGRRHRAAASASPSLSPEDRRTP